MEEREASRMAWALALSMTISSSPSRLSSLSSRRFPMNLATRQYMEFSGTILISSGKWYPYHSLWGQGQRQCCHQPPTTALCVPPSPVPHCGPMAPKATPPCSKCPPRSTPRPCGLASGPRGAAVPPRSVQTAGALTAVCGKHGEGGHPNPLNPPKFAPTDRTRMEKVLMSLSSWSSRLMDWMIMLSTRCTLNFTLARE